MSEDAISERSRRKSDLRLKFGSFEFEGAGHKPVMYILIICIGLYGAWAYIHHQQTDGVLNALLRLGESQRLVACIVSIDQKDRESQLDNPNSKCARFSRGQF